MRILLILPTCERWTGQPNEPESVYAPSLGPNSLAAVLEHHSHDVIVLDELAKWLVDKDSGYLDWTARAVQLIEKHRIEMLGITVLTHFRALALRIAQAAKAAVPGLRVVLGGPHATFTRRQLLERFPTTVDAVVAGEGETALTELVEAYTRGKDPSGIPGVATLRQPDVDVQWEANVPAPRYEHYKRLSKRASFMRAFVMASRGCPHHQCVFCTASAMRRSPLWRDLDDLAREIGHLKSFGVRELAFQDDVFMTDPIAIETLFKRLDADRVEFDQHYAHCRSRDLGESCAEALARTNRNWQFFIGLESGSPRVRSELQKYSFPVSNGQILEGVRSMQKRSIPIGVFLVFGAPGEQLHDLRETYELVRRIQPVDAFCGVLRIYPGTALCGRAIEEGRFTESDWVEKLDQPFFFYPQGDDYCRARAACELFAQWFSTERVRKHPEQSIDGELWRDSDADLARIADWKDIIARQFNGGATG